MQRAIITGASGLIGRGITQDLITSGWEVANFDVTDADAGEQSDRAIEGLRTLHCDVGDVASVKQAFADLGWDRVDLLVNNAAYINDFESTDLATLDLGLWEKVLRTNLTGSLLMTQQVLPLMSSSQARGCVINLASTRAFMSEPGDFPYAASKGGIIALTQALAVQLGPHIRVNAIAPGWISGDSDLRDIDHQQHPAGRVGRPEDIVQAVRYLLAAEFVTGEVLRVDGGMTKKMIYVH